MPSSNGQSGTEVVAALMEDVRELKKQMAVFTAKVDDMREAVTKQLGEVAAQSLVLQVASTAFLSKVESLIELYEDHERRLGLLEIERNR